MDIKTGASLLDMAIANAVKDDAGLVAGMSQFLNDNPDATEIIISTELPAYPDPDIILGSIQRWREAQKLFGKDLRIFAWSHDKRVEKYVLGCVQHMDQIYLTVLPSEYRKKDYHL